MVQTLSAIVEITENEIAVVCGGEGEQSLLNWLTFCGGFCRQSYVSNLDLGSCRDKCETLGIELLTSQFASVGAIYGFVGGSIFACFAIGITRCCVRSIRGLVHHGHGD